jgi:hypothetical protein
VGSSRQGIQTLVEKVLGFDLKPRNKEIVWFHMGAFSWHWMLEAGVGLPFGYGRGVSPAQFVFTQRPDGKCIGYNDGARVTGNEARLMARLARFVAEYQRNLWNIYERTPEKERERMKDPRWESLYNVPVRRDFIDLTEQFADWAEHSRGFRVY